MPIDPASERDATLVANEVFAERQRQMEREGWTHARDDAYRNGELAMAAICYADPASRRQTPMRWPWSADWWKPKSPRQDLIRAAALLIAEIERLDRADRAKP